MAALRRLLAAAGLALLTAAALLGLLLSGAHLLISTDAGRSLLVPRILAAVNGEIAGRLSLEGFEVGRAGAIELRGLRLLDPAGQPVIGVERLRGAVDLSRLRSRRVSLRLEMDGPRLTLRQDAAGRLNLAAALEARRPSPSAASGPSGWTVRLARLVVRGGEVDWREAEGAGGWRAVDLALDARGIFSPRGGRAEAALRGALREPLERPVSLELRASLGGDRVALPVLRASLGETALDLVAEGEPGARRGRAAALSLRVDAADLRPLAPGARLAEMGLRAYAEADGKVATAALEARPGHGKAGAAEAGLAVLLPPAAGAAGFHLQADGLDPSRVAALLPPGEVHLAAQGHAAGRDLASLRGELRLSLAPSRLRGGSLGPAEIRARAGGGTIEVTRLEGSLPGGSLRGQGSWREHGTATGSFTADLPDLGALTRNLRALGVESPPLAGSARGQASFDGRDGRVELSALLPELGQEPFGLRAAGSLSSDRRRLEIREGALSWPGMRFTLEGPARLDLQGPSVDRLALRAPPGDQRLVVEGGLSRGLLDLRLRAERLDLERIPARLLPEGLGLKGRVSLEAEARGRPRAPVAAVRAAIEEGTFRDLTGLGASAEVRLDAPARRASASLSAQGLAGEVPAAIRAALDLSGTSARLTASADYAGQRALDGELSAPLDLALLLRDPAAALRALRRAPLELQASVPGLELAPLVQRGLVPEGIAGRVQGAARLSGPLAAPRGTLRASLSDGTVAGWRGLSLEASATARGAAVELSARAGAGAQELLALTGSIGLPPERLLETAAREGAPLRLEALAPGVDLARIEGPVALVGRASLRLEASGRLSAPELSLAASGAGVGVGDRPLGDLQASGQAGAAGLTASASFRASTGGTLRGSLETQAPFSPRAVGEGRLASAPARARVEAEGLDLAILPELAPGLFRSAAGRLEARIEAEGPLSALRPQGTLRLAGGRAVVAGFGEWHGLELEASADRDAVVLSRLEARHGPGRLEAHGALRGLARAEGPGDLSGELRADRLLLSVDGQELVTLDLEAKLTGTAGAGGLDADLEVVRGTGRLPRRTPRSLQPLEPRRDVVLVTKERRRVRAGPAAARPFRTSVRILIPGTFRVEGDQPKVDVGLRGELRLTQEGGPLLAEGRIEAPGGFFEESGRLFTIRRAVVTFPGGEVSDGSVDAEAGYDSPVAKVTATVSGPVESPKVEFTSVPSLEPGQIALLIVTGRTEVKEGAGAAGPTGTEAGYGALGLLATRALRTALRDKLPVDVVAFDAGQIRMGKYVGDKFYVGYTRRYNANPEQGENANEVKVEYEVIPGWTLETRYGDANSGSASFIWSRDY